SGGSQAAAAAGESPCSGSLWSRRTVLVERRSARGEAPRFSSWADASALRRLLGRRAGVRGTGRRGFRAGPHLPDGSRRAAAARAAGGGAAGRTRRAAGRRAAGRLLRRGARRRAAGRLLRRPLRGGGERAAGRTLWGGA